MEFHRANQDLRLGGRDESQTSELLHHIAIIINGWMNYILRACILHFLSQLHVTMFMVCIVAKGSKERTT